MELIKFDHFDGSNYTRQKDKMVFLITLKIFYILDLDLAPLVDSSSDNSETVKAKKKKKLKQIEDELLFCGHILNYLIDCLYDFCSSLKSTKEIWKALETKYID